MVGASRDVMSWLVVADNDGCVVVVKFGTTAKVAS